MERSSTPSGAYERRFLAARDARQELLDRWLATGDGAVVAVSLGIPGPDKTPPGAETLFSWTNRELLAAFPAASCLGVTMDALGPLAGWRVAAPPRWVKECCIAIEEAGPAARLVDLDVYARGKGPVDRASLLRPGRPCICCDAPARECIRAGRHSHEELVVRARALLASVR